MIGINVNEAIVEALNRLCDAKSAAIIRFRVDGEMAFSVFINLSLSRGFVSLPRLVSIGTGPDVLPISRREDAAISTIVEIRPSQGFPEVGDQKILSIRNPNASSQLRIPCEYAPYPGVALSHPVHPIPARTPMYYIARNRRSFPSKGRKRQMYSTPFS